MSQQLIRRPFTPRPRRRARSALAPLAALALFGAMAPVDGALAEPIRNPLAVFSGLDKITGRIISFEVAINETVQFGALQLTPRACNTRPATEAPSTTAFVEVYEINFQSERKRLFEGWMFAASPGLHGVEHPVYDVWLTNCKGGAEPSAPVNIGEQPEPPASPGRRAR
ncbi:hypothetical protein GCM10019059_17540 [Camelimonas fluminis]|nr:hypothetical protein GCM10019059_17540 [Camelimonas fluminis]